MKIKTPIFFLFCFFLAACTAIQPVNIKLNYTPNKNQAKAISIENDKINPHIVKVEIFDKRIDQECLGSTAFPIYGTGVVQWVRDGILSLSEFGYSFISMDEKKINSGLSLEVNINRVSCRGSVMHMRCTVLIEIGFFSDGVLIQRKSYYGTKVEDKGLMSQGTRHFGENAVLHGLNISLEQCLTKFEADLRKIRD